jgi:hypothetical protein
MSRNPCANDHIQPAKQPAAITRRLFCVLTYLLFEEVISFGNKQKTQVCICALSCLSAHIACFGRLSCAGHCLRYVDVGKRVRPAVVGAHECGCLCGSMQFVAITLLTTAFHPLEALILSLLVNARHLFYGLSMLDKYKGLAR